MLMTQRIAKPMTLQEAMCHAGEMERKEGWPRCYYWTAVWWRLHAKESAAPREPLQYSRNKMALYRDIERRPEHYKSHRRPYGISDWQWSGLEQLEAQVDWAIIFDDKDRQSEFFTDHKMAMTRFDVLSMSWSCHLFKRVEGC
jgi:hypothetical protein